MSKLLTDLDRINARDVVLSDTFFFLYGKLSVGITSDNFASLKKNLWHTKFLPLYRAHPL